jgi:hypothetical protein
MRGKFTRLSHVFIADCKGLYLQATSELFDSRRSVLCLLALHSSQSYSPCAIFRQQDLELDLKPFCNLSSAPKRNIASTEPYISPINLPIARV